MAAAAGRLFLPRVADGPLAGYVAHGSDQPEDWTEIEAMLAAPTPAQEAAALARARRRRAVPLFISAAVASTAFAGLLTAAFWGVTSSCALRSDGCTSPALQAANPARAPSPQQATPTNRVADAVQPGAAQAPVVQGRSVSETEAKPDAATVEPTPPEAEPGPTRRGRSHRHHRTMQ